jgi:hypothetical protein
MSAFEKQRFALRSISNSPREQKFLDRVAEVEEEWWQWCSTGQGTPSVISVEANEFLELVDTARCPHPFRRTVIATCEGLFRALEEKGYWDSKYGVWQNFSAIDAVANDLDKGICDSLTLREVKRQEEELLVLADGFGPETRAKLDAAIGDRRLLGDYASQVKLDPIPD